MKVSDGKIVECTEIELFFYYLTHEWDAAILFDEYKRRCAANGTKITNEVRKVVVSKTETTTGNAAKE